MIVKHGGGEITIEASSFKEIHAPVYGTYVLKTYQSGPMSPEKGLLDPVSFDTKPFILLPDAHGEMLTEFNEFMDAEGEARRVLIYGPTGTGKTMFPKWLANKHTDKILTIVLDPNKLYAMDLVKEITRQQKVLLIVDEFDRYKPPVEQWLNYLDGTSDTLKNIFIVMTTNHAEKFPRVLLDRPGRLDSLYEINQLSKSDLKIYLAHKLEGSSKFKDADLKEAMMMPLAYLNELVHLCRVKALSFTDGIARMKKRKALVEKIYGTPVSYEVTKEAESPFLTYTGDDDVPF